jgi:hypothetical protein
MRVGGDRDTSGAVVYSVGSSKDDQETHELSQHGGEGTQAPALKKYGCNHYVRNSNWRYGLETRAKEIISDLEK